MEAASAHSAAKEEAHRRAREEAQRNIQAALARAAAKQEEEQKQKTTEELVDLSQSPKAERQRYGLTDEDALRLRGQVEARNVACDTLARDIARTKAMSTKVKPESICQASREQRQRYGVTDSDALKLRGQVAARNARDEARANTSTEEAMKEAAQAALDRDLASICSPRSICRAPREKRQEVGLTDADALRLRGQIEAKKAQHERKAAQERLLTSKNQELHQLQSTLLSLPKKERKDTQQQVDALEQELVQLHRQFRAMKG